MPVRRLISIALTLACLGMAAACGDGNRTAALRPTEATLVTTATLPKTAENRVDTPTPISTKRQTRTQTPIPTKTEYPTWTSTPTIPQATQIADLLGTDLLPHGARFRLGNGRINQVAVSPDGKSVAIAGDRGISLYQRDPLEEVWSIPTRQRQGFINFSADGMSVFSLTITTNQEILFTTLNTIYEVGPVYEWNIADGQNRRILDIHGYGMDAFGLAFSPNRRFLAISTFEDVFDVWDLENGVRITSMHVPLQYFDCLDFSDDGKMLAARSGSNIVLVDLEQEAVIWEENLDEKGAGRIAIAPDGKVVAFDRGGQLLLWEIGREFPSFILEGLPGNITQIRFSPGGEMLAAGDDEGHVAQWDLHNGRLQQALGNPGGPVTSIAFLEEGAKILAGSADGVYIWSAASGKSMESLAEVYSFWRKAEYASGQNAIALWMDGEVRFVDPKTAARRRTLQYPVHAPLSADFRFFAYRSEDGKVVIADSSDGGIRYAWQAPEYLETINSSNFFFSPDGKTIAIIKEIQGSIYARYAELWDMRSGKRLLTLEYKPYSWANTFYLDFSPKGGLIALGYWDWEYGEAYEVFDTVSGQSVFIGASRSRHFLEFSPDEKAILSPCDGKPGLCLQDLLSGDEIIVFSLDYEGFTGSLSATSFSPDGKRLAFGTEEGMLSLVDVTTDEALRIFEGHNGLVEDLSFSPDGKTLVSVGDGSVILWDAVG
jgi:WD40 repeat protein